MNDRLLDEIERQVAKLPPDMHEEVRQQVVLSCLEDGVSIRGVKARIALSIKSIRRSFYSTKYRDLSIDAPIPGSEDGATFAQLLPNQKQRIRRDPGRPQVSRIEKTKCAACGNWFSWLRWNGPKCRRRKYCSRQCYGAAVSVRRTRIKLTHRQLRELYAVQKMSLHAIANLCGVRHTSVHFLMREYDIPRRPTGQNHPPANRCVVSGCEAALHKWHRKANGELWGNRCLVHYREYNNAKTKRYEQRQRLKKAA